MVGWPGIPAGVAGLGSGSGCLVVSPRTVRKYESRGLCSALSSTSKVPEYFRSHWETCAAAGPMSFANADWENGGGEARGGCFACGLARMSCAAELMRAPQQQPSIDCRLWPMAFCSPTSTNGPSVELQDLQSTAATPASTASCSSYHLLHEAVRIGKCSSLLSAKRPRLFRTSPAHVVLSENSFCLGLPQPHGSRYCLSEKTARFPRETRLRKQQGSCWLDCHHKATGAIA